MLKHLIVALATSLALFSTAAPVALADNITNSPSISTNSRSSGSSSQGLTTNGAASKRAKSASNYSGKAAVSGTNKLSNAGQSAANKGMKSADNIGAVVSKNAISVSGGTVVLPSSAGNNVTNMFVRAKTVIDWAGQNIISLIVMAVMFGTAIGIVVMLGRILLALIGFGKTSVGKLLLYLLGLIILIAIIPGIAGIFGYGTGIYQLISWIFTG